MSEPITRLNAALEGRYHIERQLGEGGMATVYLARDEKHNRPVALKVLKSELAAVVGAERFLAEIETTANLQHPHILALFDSGEADNFLFYVMPFVEGESLRERLDREHQLPVDEAVRIASSVGSALDYAHRHGVIHRDIKPANILIHDGQPVISDFGIALAVSAGGGGRLTETGLSLGTPHYMSPEQATGDLSIGAATDIYALGCVLYEMLVGEPPYTGSTPQAILGKIVTGDPDPVTKHRRSVPANVEAAILKGLEKVPADRFMGAAEFVGALADAGFRHGAMSGVGASSSEQSWKRLAIGAVVVAALATGLGVRQSLTSESSAAVPPRVALTVTAPPGAEIDANWGLAISPDERTIVFHDFANRRLFRRNLGESTALPIPGTESSWRPFFSPDGEWIAFVDDTENTLEKVRLDGSGLQTLASVPATGRSGAWTEDGDIIVNSRGLGGLSLVSESGGELRPVAREAGGVYWLQLLPGGRTVIGGQLLDGVQQVVAVDLETADVRVLFPGVTPRYVSEGEVLVYGLGGSLWAVPFDLQRLEVTGEPTLIAQGVQSGEDRAAYEVTADLLVYQAGGMGGQQQPMWVDRDGNREALPVEPGTYATPKISPDGRRVALVQEVDGNNDIIIHDLGSRTTRRLTFDAASEWAPLWTPDGERIVFSSDRDGAFNLYWRSVDGADAVERLTTTGDSQIAYGWTSDGALVFVGDGGVWTAHLEPGAPHTPVLVDSSFTNGYATVSPDGAYVAVQSTRFGHPEVFVHRLSDGGGQRMVSTLDIAPFSGIQNADIRDGRAPLWSPLGDELYYLSGQSMVRVPVSMTDGFDHESPDVIFEAFWRTPTQGRHYDMSPDGNRFLIVEFNGANNELTVVQNWRDVLADDAR